ncbi:MAG: hypothetical protein L0229_30470 [Blastocatellia bacterium]|nr:hypothetical protein [Blastocatellia bacterium]
MSGTANLAPGSIVPKTGKYKCEFCGEGGMADFFAKALKGSDLGLNVGGLEGVGRQGTVRFFDAGKKFSQCPTCGPATGWTLIEETSQTVDKPSLSHSETISEHAVCDICSQRVYRPRGYLLTTKDVVSQPAYWRHYYQHHRSEFSGMGVSSFEEFCRNPLLRSSCAETLARQTTPWIVCDNCIPMFTVDREKSLSYAKRWWESDRKFTPQGGGPAPLSAVNMGDREVGFSNRVQESEKAAKRKWWQFWK